MLVSGDCSTLNGVDDAVHYAIVSPQDTRHVTKAVAQHMRESLIRVTMATFWTGIRPTTLDIIYWEAVKSSSMNETPISETNV